MFLILLIAIVPILINITITVMREQHEAEMTQLESLVSSSRGLLRKQNKRFLEQVEPDDDWDDDNDQDEDNDDQDLICY